jgi:hypothetical protein
MTYQMQMCALAISGPALMVLAGVTGWGILFLLSIVCFVTLLIAVLFNVGQRPPEMKE